MKCKICEQRKPRRYCPGVGGDICSICCGNEREQSIDCPFDCPYLQEAHNHERPAEFDLNNLPNRDILLEEGFAHEHSSLLNLLLAITYRAALWAKQPTLLPAPLTTPQALDADLLEALENVIRTLRALESGLYYDSRPQNPVAASIYLKIREGLDEVRKEMDKTLTIPKSQFVAVLVYIQREAIFRNNGRRKCRAFLEILHRMFAEVVPAESASPLIIS